MSDTPSAADILAYVLTQAQQMNQRLARIEASRQPVVSPLPRGHYRDPRVPNPCSARAPGLGLISHQPINPKKLNGSEEVQEASCEIDDAKEPLPGTGTTPCELPLADSTRPLPLRVSIPSEVTHFRDLGQARTHPEEPQLKVVHDTPPGPCTKPKELPIEDSTRSLGSILSIPSEVRHWGSLGRGKSPDNRVCSGEDRDKLHGHDHGEEELPGSSSARSFSPSFDIHRQVAYLGEVDRGRITLDWFEQGEVLGMPPGHDPRQEESTMLRSVCWIGLCFFIHRQFAYDIGFDRSKACQVQVNLRDGPARPSGSIPREEEFIRMRAACSFGSGFHFHQPIVYEEAFDQGKSSLVRAYIEDGPARPSGGYPRKKKLTRMRAACSFGSSFNFHQQSAYWEAFDRGKSSLIQAHVGDGSSRPSGGYPRRRNPTHSKAACSFGSYFRICWQNTPRRVFDRGKSVLDRADLRVGPRGPIPPYTGRSKRQAPLRHWDREFLPPGHVLMKPIRPLEALATPLHVARPRAKKFGLTGEVFAFSLKLLLFPFDPGIIFMLCHCRYC